MSNQCVSLNLPCHRCGHPQRGDEIYIAMARGGPQLCFGCYAMSKIRRYRFLGWVPWRRTA